MRLSKLVLVGLIGLTVAGITTAGLVDLSGGWDLSMQMNLAGSGDAGDGIVCVYSGTTDVVQDGSSLSGDASYVLEQGGDGCPSELLGSYTGVITTSGIEMGAIMGGNLGTATFTGFFFLPFGTDGLGVVGDVSVTSGPFAGSSGSWGASRGLPPINVPTLGTSVLPILALTILTLGVVALRRRMS